MRRTLVNRLWTVFLAAWVIFAVGCGGSQEKGKNSAKDDRPKSGDKVD